MAECDIVQVSLPVADYNSIKKEISGLKRVQQHHCNAFIFLAENCKQYISEPSRAKIDAECAHATQTSSASKVSSFRSTIGGVDKCLTGFKPVPQELSEENFAHSLTTYLVAFLNTIAFFAHSYTSDTGCGAWYNFQTLLSWAPKERILNSDGMIRDWRRGRKELKNFVPMVFKNEEELSTVEASLFHLLEDQNEGQVKV